MQETPISAKEPKLYESIPEEHPLLNTLILGLMQLTPASLEMFYPVQSVNEILHEETILEMVIVFIDF
jgi:hypothetical protein